MRYSGGGPIWLREGAVTVIWSAAAVNVFILTWKTMVGVYKPGPLSGKPSESESESNKSEGKKENWLEEGIKSGLKAVLPFPLGEGPGIG